MKKCMLFFIIAFIANASHGQNQYGFEKKISFIIGGGFSVTPSRIYKDPVINLSNNTVSIEDATRIKPNLTLGISYTPKIVEIERKVKDVDEAGNKITKNVIGYDTRGFTMALFFNPIGLSTTTANLSIASSVDLGLGLGYKFGDFSIFLTGEFYSIRQPRKYFVDQFMNKNLPYIIDNDVQKSINVNDNNIFVSQPIFAIGLKFAYTFDVISKFNKTVSENSDSESSESGYRIGDKVGWLEGGVKKEGKVIKVLNNKLKIYFPEGGNKTEIVKKFYEVDKIVFETPQPEPKTEK